MELAEVKKYFENAEFVESVSYNEKRKVDLDSIWVDCDLDFWSIEKETRYIFCLGSKKRGFAKILTTKEPSFSITKDQLRQLTDPKVKEWFPEVFKVELEVGKWYKNLDEGYEKSICYAMELYGDNHQFSGYGFDYELKWFYGKDTAQCGSENWVEATKKEVFEALKIEAVRRGFVKGARITPMFPSGKDYYPDENIISRPLNFKLKGNIFEVDGGVYRYRIFVNGKWATVLSAITKSEAEKLLNKKIID